MEPSIAALPPESVLAAGALLARAIEPSYAAEMPNPTARLHFCTLLYTANTRWSLDKGLVWCTTAADGTLTGVLSLIPKPEPEGSPEDDARYGYDLLEPFNDSMTNIGDLEHAAHAPLEAIIGPWTYINVLGVDPPHQGHGLGTSLMQHAIAEADLGHLPMGLITDTARNVAFYTRLGFATVLEGPDSDILKLWTMIRPARPETPQPAI